MCGDYIVDVCVCEGTIATTSEYKEPAYDCPLQLEENPAYEVVQK